MVVTTVTELGYNQGMDAAMATHSNNTEKARKDFVFARRDIDEYISTITKD